MEAKTKQRWIGGLIIASLIAIFLPILFCHTHPEVNLKLSNTIPHPPSKPNMALDLPTNYSVTESTQPQTSTKPSQLMLQTKVSPLAVVHVAAPPTLWSLQLASFTNFAHANLLQSRLKHSGYSAYLRRFHIHDHGIFSVYVGPYTHLHEAKNFSQTIQQQFKLKAIVKKYYHLE